MANANASSWGRYYWCIGLIDETLTKVYVHADDVSIDEGGALVCKGGRRSEEGEPPPETEAYTTLAFGSGQWQFVFAASVMDGHPVAVEHWPGLIDE